MVDMPADGDELSNDEKQQIEPHNWRERLALINLVLLTVSFCDQTRLITSNKALLVKCTIQYYLDWYRLISWRQLDLCPRVVALYTVQLLANCAPLGFSFSALHGLLICYWVSNSYQSKSLETSRRPSPFQWDLHGGSHEASMYSIFC